MSYPVWVISKFLLVMILPLLFFSILSKVTIINENWKELAANYLRINYKINGYFSQVSIIALNFQSLVGPRKPDRYGRNRWARAYHENFSELQKWKNNILLWKKCKNEKS